jgi:hypothetical protein
MNRLNISALLATFVSLQLLSASAFSSISIDGVLDEPEWQSATVFRDFVTVEPLTGEKAKYATEVRLMTDDDGVYVGFTNYQPASVKRVNRRFPRDSRIKADRNIVSIDFDGTAVSAYDFTVGSANSRQDGVLGGGDYSTDWDGTWYSQTSSEGDYWYSEIHIPWTVAPIAASTDGIKNMAIWFSRVVYDESLRFAFPNAFYTRNTFMEDWYPIEVEQPKAASLDWFPYLSYNKNLQDDFAASNDGAKAGLDFIWRPNSGTQLTAAINPDFGQVESDDLVVNFSAFETFVSEKRPFFTENQALFSSEIPNEDRVLYTRRIGSGTASDGGLVDIELAGKLSYFGKNVDMGLFVVSENDDADQASSQFISSRVQRKVNNLAFGHRLTYSNRDLLQREATVQVVDANWQYSSSVELRGQLLHSNIEQQANLYNDNQDLSTQDFAGWMNWFYVPSDQWQHNLYLSRYGDQFDMNDMGYMKRNNFTEFYGSSRYDQLSFPDNSSLLSSYKQLEYGHSESNDGLRLESWANIEFEWVFRSSRKLTMDMGTQLPGWDNLISRGNGLYAKPRQNWGSLIYRSPRGDDFVYRLRAFFETDEADKLSTGITFKPRFYLSEKLTLGFELTYKDYRQWLIWDSEVSQLATYTADSYYTDVRLDWYPSSKQEIRLKFQWVGIDATVLGSHLLDSTGSLVDSDVASSNFSVSDTAFQLRYRYQLAPLSDIFLVYSRGGFFASDDGNEGPGALFDEGWRGVAVESFIAKIRYRF